MKKTIWVSPSPNGGWREHRKNDIDLISTRDGCVERAREISKRQDEEIRRQTLLKGKGYIIGVKNSYGRDPFPPHA